MGHMGEKEGGYRRARSLAGEGTGRVAQAHIHAFVDECILTIARGNDVNRLGYLLIFVKTDPEIRHEGVSTFILEKIAKVFRASSFPYRTVRPPSTMTVCPVM